MKAVRVFMLGGFEIVADGNEVIKNLGSSKKRIILLEYLLLNRDRALPLADLYEVLWPGENSTNPESALKTLVSRLRATLAGYTPLLADCIVTERGGYRWNPALDCEIDIYAFEELCTELLAAEAFEEELRAKMNRVLTLYAGELLPGAGAEAWVASRSVALHKLYLKTVRHYIALAKPLALYEEIAELCRMALDVDAFDAQLQLELMNALLQTGQSTEALSQFSRASDLPRQEPGGAPSEGMLDFYKKLMSIDQDARANLESIRRDLLWGQEKGDGAFVCDYVILRDIYQLYMRNLARLGTTMFVALVTISPMDDAPVEPLHLDKLMRLLLDVLRENLRRGDTIARYSSMQYAVLLPAVSFETGRVPLERVKKAFYQKYASPAFTISYRFAPVAEEK